MVLRPHTPQLLPVSVTRRMRLIASSTPGPRSRAEIVRPPAASSSLCAHGRMEWTWAMDEMTPSVSSMPSASSSSAPGVRITTLTGTPSTWSASGLS